MNVDRLLGKFTTSKTAVEGGKGADTIKTEPDGIFSGALKSLGLEKGVGAFMERLASNATDPEARKSPANFWKYVDAGIVPTLTGFVDSRTGESLSDEQIRARVNERK